MLKKRASGVLLHISSLASEYGIGDLGPAAYEFADFLKGAKQSYWQILPLGPMADGYPYSPYNGLSAFAGNTLVISPELLWRDGFLSRKELDGGPTFPAGSVDFRLAVAYKRRVLNFAFERFKNLSDKTSYDRFCLENVDWLEDFAMFMALRWYFQQRSWIDWPLEIRCRKKEALKSVKIEFDEQIEREKFFQYLFFEQWDCLRGYCNAGGVEIIGDIPIYISYDSSDVWAHRENFKLTGGGRPRFISGVPPDQFSSTGQLWGNPVYDWRYLKEEGFLWWVQRVRLNLRLYDIIRIDHFRGLVAYWQVPAGEETAENGKWVKAGSEDFFNTLYKKFPSMPIIVEDLGHITDDVKKVIEQFNLPCMNVLQYGFDSKAAENPHCPCNYVKNSVVYTGTHDNNTVNGWFEKEAGGRTRKRLFDFLGYEAVSEQVHWEMIGLAMSSACDMVIIAAQDLLGLDSKARMNRPGTIKGNWKWRLLPGEMTTSVRNKLLKLTGTFGRG